MSQLGQIEAVTLGDDPAEAQVAESMLRQPNILSVEEAARQIGMDISYLRDLIRFDQVKLEQHASDKRVQVGGPREIAEAKRCAREHIPYQIKWRTKPAREVWHDWWNGPMGKSRIMSTAHRREMENMRRGYPADYYGPSGSPLVTDEVLTEVRHAVDRGEDMTEATYAEVAPQLLDDDGHLPAEPAKKRRGRPPKARPAEEPSEQVTL